MLSRLFGRYRRSREPWRPREYRATATDAGADINYTCYCGCEAGFALDRSILEAEPERCCCGNAMLVGEEAGQRLLTLLDDESEYRLDLRLVDLPWGDQTEVALAIPRGSGARR